MTAPARQIATGDLPLTVGTLTDGQFLKRDGTTIISAAGGGGGGDALTSNPLSQFAATTSAQLAGVISDEVGFGGTGLLVFNNAPSIISPTFTTSVQFSQVQALQFVIENRTSDPGSPVAGQLWLRTDL